MSHFDSFFQALFVCFLYVLLDVPQGQQILS